MQEVVSGQIVNLEDGLLANLDAIEIGKSGGDGRN
jgi:hypothetical protein